MQSRSTSPAHCFAKSPTNQCQLRVNMQSKSMPPTPGMGGWLAKSPTTRCQLHGNVQSKSMSTTPCGGWLGGRISDQRLPTARKIWWLVGEISAQPMPTAKGEAQSPKVGPWSNSAFSTPSQPPSQPSVRKTLPVSELSKQSFTEDAASRHASGHAIR